MNKKISVESRSLFFIAFLVLCSFVSEAGIKITVYGSGGLISDGSNHKVCPNKSSEVCAKLDVPQVVSEGITGVLEVFPEREKYEIRVVDFSQGESGEMDGSQLLFEIISE